ncbi:DNRLRE domain-containing protein [Clostridiales bacterium COT073_COT-073]|nr:DNRLRE domain-containing protein [Clostridiales bacterium COT073_COT-073]
MKRIGKQILAICLAFILFAGQISAADTYYANRSTRIDATNNNKNKPQYKHREMIIKAIPEQNGPDHREGLIGFSLQTGDYSDVDKATLRLYVTTSSVTPSSIEVFGFDSAWDEKTATWMNKPDFSQEEKAGEGQIVEKDDWVEVDVTAYFKKQIVKGTQFSFHIKGDARTKSYIKLAGAPHGNKPELVLERGAVQPPVPAPSGDTQADVDVNQVARKVTMAQNDEMLKSLYINEKDPDKNRFKTDTVLVGQEYSAYFYTDTVKEQNPDSAFLRFYVQEDYYIREDETSQPIPVEIWGVANPAEVGENTTYNARPATEAAMIYELNITNKGWYTVDVTDYVRAHNNYAFYFKAKDPALPVVKISSYNSEKTPVLYTSKGMDEFDEVRQRFAIKKGTYDVNDPQVKALLERVDKKVDGYLAELNTDPNRDCLFWKLPLVKDKQNKPVKIGDSVKNMRTSYVWLSDLLRAYHTKGSKYEDSADLYQKIKDGLEFLYHSSYNPFATEEDNWWQWEIGVPKVLGEIIAIMYDDLDPQVRMNYLNAIYRFQPDPEISYYNRNATIDKPKYRLPQQKSTGANRIDTCIGDLLLGICAKNPELMQHSIDALGEVYQYVTSGEGFYRDGSFIQHKNVGYTTAYGMVLIGGLSNLNSKTKGSRWQITDPSYENVYEWIDNAFIPMVFDGQAFPITAGRSLSRQAGNNEWGANFADGYKIARTLYAFAEAAPADKQAKWRALARRFMDKNSFYDVKANAGNINMLNEYEDLQNVEMAEPYIGSHVFANMDRVVHHRQDYAVALAMYSSRTQNFEMMNNENLKGWNQGNGTLYLLNQDAGQYDDGFWPTVDPYRLAGTTIDVVARLSQDHKEEFTMNSDFVGGTSLDNLYSVATMDLKEPIRKNITHYNTTLTTKKSWFFFDDEIIALGSGINSTDNREIETIVENRMIRPDASNQVLVNGNPVLTAVSAGKEKFDQTSWAYLEGSKSDKAGIGYYFPEPVSLTAIKQKRDGSWRSINKSGKTDLIHRNYVTMWLEHGKNPVNADYSYALLPGKSADEVQAYAAAPQYEVRKNTPEVQAVYEKELGILAANVFDKKAGDLGDVKVSEASSLMLLQKDGKISLSVADPTMKLNAPVTLELALDKEITITDKSKQVKVLSTKPLKLEISLKDNLGQAATLHGTYKAEKPTPKPEEPKPQPEKPKTENPLISYQPAPSESPAASEKSAEKAKDKDKTKDKEGEKTPEGVTPTVKPQLSDISESWAKTEVTELVNLGIIKGYPDSTFRPEATVSRAETAQLLTNMLDLLNIGTKAAAPESGQPWYHSAVERVKAQGLMHGDTAGNFNPDQNVSRQDMFTVLGRFGKWKMASEEVELVLAAFADSSEISDYAKPYIAQMVKMGLIKGDNGKLNPKQSISRAELSVMIYRVLKIMK